MKKETWFPAKLVLKDGSYVELTKADLQRIESSLRLREEAQRENLETIWITTIAVTKKKFTWALENIARISGVA